MNIEQERAAFEALCEENNLPLTVYEDGGGYSNERTKAALTGFRAALQSQDRGEVELSKIGRAIHRACSDLPDGYEIRIDLEKGSGIVYVTDRDGDETMIESGGELFSYQINEAIDHARRIEGDGE